MEPHKAPTQKTPFLSFFLSSFHKLDMGECLHWKGKCIMAVMKGVGGLCARA